MLPAVAAKTVLVCAMPLELRPVAKRLSLRKAGAVWIGWAGPREVVAVVTGMGTALARAGTEALLREGGVDRVVSIGITGGLAPDPPIGTLVNPETVINSATGASFRPDPLRPERPHGIMWTTDVLITGADDLAGLRARGVVSLDMETAAIAEVSERHRVAWSVFRVISDRADDGSVNPEVFALSNQDGTPNPRRVARYMLRHPGAVPRMAGMGRTVARAADYAAHAAIDALVG